MMMKVMMMRRAGLSLIICVVSPAGYDLSEWQDALLRLGQTKVFFSTTATLPYRSESDHHAGSP